MASTERRVAGVAGEGELGPRVAAALRRIARDEEIKAYVMRNGPLREVLFWAASRFVSGETLAGGLRTVEALNGNGHAASVDYMGESTRDEGMAEAATREFLRVARAIPDDALDCSVSLDLSHVGLALGLDLAVRNGARIASAAREAGTEVMVNAEGSERTDDVLEAHRQLCEEFDNVGISLQAYLHRTEDDLTAALGRPGKIRLVKGAFEEPGALAHPRNSTALDEAYRGFMEELLLSGHPVFIATHDEAMLEHARGFIRGNGVDVASVEFEMLLGVTPERLDAMREFGCRTRVYVVYGEEWYLYLCHRLAEHPTNIYQAIADAVGIA